MERLPPGYHSYNTKLDWKMYKNDFYVLYDIVSSFNLLNQDDLLIL